MTPLQKLVATKAIFINFVFAPNENNEEAYCYFGVYGDMMLKLQQDIRKFGGFDPKDYGVIIKEGLGFPTPEVMKEMEEKYSFHHDNKQIPIYTEDATASA